MPWLMVDASALIALHHPRDPHHEEALEVLRAMASEHRLVTTSHFVLEAHKRLRHDRRAPRGAAADLAAACLGAGFEVVAPEALVPFDHVLQASLEAGPGLSLEDLSGALTMRALGIRAIWAWDDDFRRLGFRVVP